MMENQPKHWGIVGMASERIGVSVGIVAATGKKMIDAGVKSANSVGKLLHRPIETAPAQAEEVKEAPVQDAVEAVAIKEAPAVEPVEPLPTEYEEIEWIPETPPIEEKKPASPQTTKKKKTSSAKKKGEPAKSQTDSDLRPTDDEERYSLAEAKKKRSSSKKKKPSSE